MSARLTPSAATTIIGAENKTLGISIDGKQGEVQLQEGSYTAQELAAELERAINTSEDFSTRNVSVSVAGSSLQITTDSYGSSSQISIQTSETAKSLGFQGTESGIGRDVVGKFIYDGVEESAVGNGQLLSGRGENEFTADLQVQVTLTDSQLVDGPEATLTVARGFASRLDAQLDAALREDGQLSTVNDRYTDVLDSIQSSIDRLNARFEAEQASLIEQFTRLETVVAELQNTGGYLAALFQG